MRSRILLRLVLMVALVLPVPFILMSESRVGEPSVLGTTATPVPNLVTRGARVSPATVLPELAALTPTPPPASGPVSAAQPEPPATPELASRPRPAVIPQRAAADNDFAPDGVCPGQDSLAQAAAVLVCLTTWARTHHGLGAVTVNPALGAAAQAKAGDLVTCGFSHTACGRAANYWIRAKGYGGGCSAENIAQGQSSPRRVFHAWMASPGHRANILSASYSVIGIGTAAGGGSQWWVMELGGCR